MDSRVEMTPAAYRSLLSQLVEVEERKNEIVDGFYPEPSEKRDEFNFFLEGYIKELEELVKTVQVVERPDREKLRTINRIPFAIIDSMVELEELSRGGTQLFRIVSPYRMSKSPEDVSCLSALGRALLLKRKGQRIEVDAGKGICIFKISGIKYDVSNAYFLYE